MDFEKFKYSQELGSRLWAALMVLLGLLAQLALRD
jgi:hypothetical protein